MKSSGLLERTAQSVGQAEVRGVRSGVGPAQASVQVRQAAPRVPAGHRGREAAAEVNLVDVAGADVTAGLIDGLEVFAVRKVADRRRARRGGRRGDRGAGRRQGLRDRLTRRPGRADQEGLALQVIEHQDAIVEAEPEIRQRHITPRGQRSLRLHVGRQVIGQVPIEAGAEGTRRRSAVLDRGAGQRLAQEVEGVGQSDARRVRRPAALGLGHPIVPGKHGGGFGREDAPPGQRRRTARAVEPETSGPPRQRQK